MENFLSKFWLYDSSEGGETSDKIWEYNWVCLIQFLIVFNGKPFVKCSSTSLEVNSACEGLWVRTLSGRRWAELKLPSVIQTGKEKKRDTNHFDQIFTDGVFGFWSIESNNNDTWKTGVKILSNYDNQEKNTMARCSRAEPETVRTVLVYRT